MLVTAGWDRSIKVYDIRQKVPVGSMYGPAVQGDSLDIFGDQIVTGSGRNRDVMQMFSMSKKKMENEFTYS